MNDSEILELLKLKYNDLVLSIHPFPKPYIGKEKIKAILLGSDPSNKSDDGKTRELEYVFGLECSESPYFKTFNNNLKFLNHISLDNLFIQNVCRNYFDCDTYKNKHWKEISSEFWLPKLKQELDVKFDNNIPILISTEIILILLVDGNISKKMLKANDLYTQCTFIDAGKNILNRKLIPFYRHPKYQLKNWNKYRIKIDSCF
jgi:hypothetical protein